MNVPQIELQIIEIESKKSYQPTTTMAALHYMLDYVLRTSPSDLLPEQTSPTDHDRHDFNEATFAPREYEHPLKKHYKDHIQRTPELTHHGPYATSPKIKDEHTSSVPTYQQRIIDSQRDQIDALERKLRAQKEQNRELQELVANMKDTMASFYSPRKRLSSVALGEDTYGIARKDKRRTTSPELSDDDEGDEDYHDTHPTEHKKRRLFKSKEDRHEVSVFDEHQYGTQSNIQKVHTPKRSYSPVASSETKFTLPSDIMLDKKYFLKWSGEVYAVAKAFGDRNRLRKLVAKYESETDKKASYLLDGDELRKLKALNPICHNTSYLGLYNLEFVRYFQNTVGSV